MKADRLFVIRAAALLLMGLLLMAGIPAAGGPLRIGRLKISYESHSKQLAQALALEVKGVQTRFDDSRRALHAVKGGDGKPAYLRKDVTDLIDHTGKDLDDAIVKVQPLGRGGVSARRLGVFDDLRHPPLSPGGLIDVEAAQDTAPLAIGPDDGGRRRGAIDLALRPEAERGMRRRAADPELHLEVLVRGEEEDPVDHFSHLVQNAVGQWIWRGRMMFIVRSPAMLSAWASHATEGRTSAPGRRP